MKICFECKLGHSRGAFGASFYDLMDSRTLDIDHWTFWTVDHNDFRRLMNLSNADPHPSFRSRARSRSRPGLDKELLRVALSVDAE